VNELSSNDGGQQRSDVDGEASDDGRTGDAQPDGNATLGSDSGFSRDQDSGHGQDSGTSDDPDGGSIGPHEDAGLNPTENDAAAPAENDAGSNPPPPVCAVGTTTCDGNQVKTCIGTGWQFGLPCEFGCNAGKCNVCEPGETRCDGLDVQVCNGHGWTTTEGCGYLCQAGECLEQECTPNEVFCEPNMAGAKCNALGTEWSLATSCQGHCGAGQADCNNSPADGCETNTKTVNNCGGCGITCSVPGAANSCVNGSCTHTPFPNQYDCDQQAENGYEVNVLTDVNNCGACGANCNAFSTGGVAACVNGFCVTQCDGTHGNCDGDRPYYNGCETTLDTMTNCGGCGITCDAGSETCQAGVCTSIACSPGTGNCDSNLANGCETSTTTLTNCGGCGIQCETYPNMTASCNGSCQYACAAGFANVDGSLANGCEVNLKTNVNHCGTVGNVCGSNGGTASCSNGTCAISCSVGRANCDGLVSNGCEVNTTADLGNCGACGNTCSAGINGDTMCSASSCVTSCQPNYGDCDGNTANGCELNLSEDVNNCGGCGNVCLGAGNSCNQGQCQYDVTEVYVGHPRSGFDGAIATPGAKTNETVRQIASDAENLYLITGWQEYPDGGFLSNSTSVPKSKLVKVSKSGGDPVILSTEGYVPTSLVVRNGYVFWNDHGSPTLCGQLGQLCITHKVLRTPVNGGTTTKLVEDYSYASNIVVNDSYVFWVSFEQGPPAAFSTPPSNTTTVYRVSVNGGARQVLATIPEVVNSVQSSEFLSSDVFHVSTWGSTKDSNGGFIDQGIYAVNMTNGIIQRLIGGQRDIRSAHGHYSSTSGSSLVWYGTNAAWDLGTWSWKWLGNQQIVKMGWGGSGNLQTDGIDLIAGAKYIGPLGGTTFTTVSNAGNGAAATSADDTHTFWSESVTGRYVVRVAPRP